MICDLTFTKLQKFSKRKSATYFLIITYMNKTIATFRGLLVFTSMVFHLLPGIAKSIFSKNYLPLALRMRQSWARSSLKILGARIEVKGNLPTGGPYLFIGNHRSYIDPVVALKDIKALPVAKAEVSSWPLIGYAAKATGVMWVKRDNKNSRAATMNAMEDTLRKGFSVLVYPEGTTHVEPVTSTFKKGAFRLASKLQIPIVPIALEYGDMGHAWVGNDTFGPHFIRCFGKKKMLVKVHYGAPIISGNAEELMETTKKWIDKNMLEMRRDFDKSSTITAPA